MDPVRWERAQALFHRVAELPLAERESWLAAHEPRDPELLVCVRQMLAADARPCTLLDQGVAHLADSVLARTGTLPAGVPSVLGPYRLLRVLGEGGMGVVYLAERADLGSRAAIKILRDGWLSPARRERFAAEQRTLARLNHPSIAQLHDAESTPDGTSWFVMEYVEGQPLTEYCRRHETSLEGRLELVRSVGEAVQYAHAQAVIHRDLKPSNILVTADGTVKLLDFGIAKHLEGVDATVDQTRTGLRLMTPAYASPEQLRGEPVGIRTDVYSLGVITYELLTGRVPFDTGVPEEAAARAAMGPREAERPSVVARRATQPVGLRRRDGVVPGRLSWADLDVLCATAMHWDPERRYPTVDALTRDIDHFLRGEPLEARPDSVRYRLGKFVRRNRKAVLASVLALAVAAYASVFYAARLAAARDEALAESARTQRIQHFLWSLFEGGDEAGPAEELRVTALLERGIGEARSLDQEPVVQAELYRTLGTIHQKLGQFERANQLLDLALARQQELLGSRHLETMTTRVALGLLRLDQARLEEAEGLVREALDWATQVVGREHPMTVGALGALGRVLEARGQYDDAIRVNSEVVAVYERQDRTSPEYASALGQLADAHYYAGHYEAADELNHEVLTCARRIYGDVHPRVADVLINLGASQADRGRYLEAENFYRLALARLESFYGADHFRSASAMTMLGRVLVYQRKFDEGQALLERSSSIQERVHGPVHPRVASALNDLGSAALQEDRLDDAAAYFQRTLEIYQSVYGEEHSLVATATSNLASVLTSQQDFARAEELFRRAVGIFGRTLAPGHLSTGIARIKLGRSLLGLGRYAEAAEETLAGYEIVKAQASPGVSWLRAARNDLVAAYEALGESERAAAFRAELQNAETQPDDRRR
ncbi:MAG: tetratricopeptide repeat protein [Planctomycetota bacterium]